VTARSWPTLRRILRRTPAEVPPELLRYDPDASEEDRDAQRAAGMEWCGRTGYSVVDYLRDRRAARLAALGWADEPTRRGPAN
jgi:hypothetical protein